MHTDVREWRVAKIILKILSRRVEYKANNFLGYDQFGFRKGCGTREAIGIMRTIGERYLQLGNGVYVWFIDYEKAFHRVMDLPPWRS